MNTNLLTLWRTYLKSGHLDIQEFLDFEAELRSMYVKHYRKTGDDWIDASVISRKETIEEILGESP